MRLTNAMRQTIRTNVSQDLTSVADVRGQMQARAIEIAADKLPRLVRQVWNDPKLRGFVHTVWTHDGISTAYYLPAAEQTDFKLLEDPTYAALAEQLDALQSLNKLALASLDAALGSVTTVEQLVDRYPDLVKYLPAPEQAVANLPATTELMDKLRAAGLRTGDVA